MLSELFYFMLGVTSEFTECSKNPKVNCDAVNEYVSRLGYNKIRQEYLEKLINSADKSEQEKLYDVLGHRIEWSEYNMYDKSTRYIVAKREAIKEIATKECWRYYDIQELLNDPMYMLLSGIKKVPVAGKVLMSHDELKRFKSDMRHRYKEYKETTVVSCVLPITLTIMAVISAFTAQSIVGGIVYFAFGILATIATYYSFFKYSNKKANGYVQLFAYMLCPYLSLIQVSNCEPLKECPTLSIIILLLIIAHTVCFVGYGIYSHYHPQ